MKLVEERDEGNWEFFNPRKKQAKTLVKIGSLAISQKSFLHSAASILNDLNNYKMIDSHTDSIRHWITRISTENPSCWCSAVINISYGEAWIHSHNTIRKYSFVCFHIEYARIDGREIFGGGGKIASFKRPNRLKGALYSFFDFLPNQIFYWNGLVKLTLS